jgi:hypothetical protein
VADDLADTEIFKEIAGTVLRHFATHPVTADPALRSRFIAHHARTGKRSRSRDRAAETSAENLRIWL